MSRLRISNYAQLKNLAFLIADSAAQTHHRGLLVISDLPEHWLSQFARSCSIEFVETTAISDRSDRINAILGKEFTTLAHDIHPTVDAGLLAALAGTVVAGGVLILGIPKSNEHTKPGRFYQRFITLLTQAAESSPQTIQLAQWRDSAREDLQAHKQQNNAGKTTTQQSSAPAANQYQVTSAAHPQRSFASLARPYGFSQWQQDKPVNEQNALYRQALDYLKVAQTGSVVIMGRRGRGKSTLMARLAQWLSSQGQSFHCTAAQRSAMSSLHTQGIDLDHCFLPPDRAKNGSASFLLVDEAGSLPLSLLSSYLDQYQYCVFCTTVEGYESAGRAFELRFVDTIKSVHADALVLTPRQSWRWAHGDALEWLIDRWLLLAPEPAKEIIDEQVRYTVAVKQINRDTLASDETLLQAVFSLLKETHYQTNTLDLQHLLDSDNTQLWIAQSDDVLLGVLLLALEGNIDTQLHESIVSKQRRLPHQLLPQLLAQSANRPEALSARYARVVRISVQKSARRRGIGSTMLKTLETRLGLSEPGLNTIGASFASDKSSLAFWAANGFTRFHMGFRLNPRTGTYAVAVMKTLDTVVDEVLQTAASIHQDNQHCASAIAAEDTQAQREPGAPLASLDLALLQRFTHKQRSVNDTLAALYRLAHQTDAEKLLASLKTQSADEVLVRKLLNAIARP